MSPYQYNPANQIYKVIDINIVNVRSNSNFSKNIDDELTFPIASLLYCTCSVILWELRRTAMPGTLLLWQRPNPDNLQKVRKIRLDEDLNNSRSNIIEDMTNF